MRRRRNPEIIAGRVNADGTIAAGDGFTVQKGTAGLFDIICAPGFRVICATTTSVTGTAWCHAMTFTGNTIHVETYNSAASPTNYGFSFVAAGIQQ